MDITVLIIQTILCIIIVTKTIQSLTDAMSNEERKRTMIIAILLLAVSYFISIFIAALITILLGIGFVAIVLIIPIAVGVALGKALFNKFK